MTIERTACGLAAMIAIAVGCGGRDPTGGSEIAVDVRTDRTVYQVVPSGATYRAMVVVTITNNGRAPVFLKRCTQDDASPVYQVYRPGAETPSRGLGRAWACPGGVPSPITLRAAESITDTVVLLGNVSGDIGVAEVTGEFVVRYAVYGSYNTSIGTLGDPDEDVSESNVFHVVIGAKM
ncbi:MAG: hypothetical protein ACREL7_00480 [Longimicrobiales bacterium]